MSDSSLVKREATPANAPVEAAVVPREANPVGTKDAPVDGKDGLPHQGPFVETSAERDRKRTKESDDQELAVKEPPVEHTVEPNTPISNDGVMDDPNRLGPKEGTRGTEGGVSEKSKDSKYEDKVPDPPKKEPPLPHSEIEKIGAEKGPKFIAEEEKKLLEVINSISHVTRAANTNLLLQKPADLPEKPHDLPPPDDPVPHKDTSIQPDDGIPSYRNPKSSLPTTDEEPSAVIQPMHSLLLSFTMILFSEVGDKTFLVAALMAMRHDRMVVFTAAFSALVTMTVLSALLGHAVPTLIPKSVTNFLAAALFLVFGGKMLLEARKISPDEGVSEEMKEVEMELEEKEHQQRRRDRRRSSAVTPYVLEAGRGGVRKARSSTTRLPSPPESPSPSSSRDNSPSRNSLFANTLAGINNLFSLLLSPAWVQTFVMTFLGEWGDRSQIATIAMAAGQDYWWVTAGALCGHAICTAAAVIGGRAIAGRVSLRVGELSYYYR
jgi:putative Ca2+/H+ antiporter (TMEM165/GDT1 family)